MIKKCCETLSFALFFYLLVSGVSYSRRLLAEESPENSIANNQNKKTERGGEENKSGKPEKEEFTLEEIVVTATRRESKVFDVPYTANILTGEEIVFRRNPRTVPEIFFEDPDIIVQKTSRGQESPFIRGFTGFRTLFLIDGIRLNSSVFRDGPNEYWGTVDPFAINRLEIVKGPSSVLYGSDAIGGTVNAITSEKFSYEGEYSTKGRIFYRYSSADRGHVGRLEGSVTDGKALGLFAGFSLKSFDDLDAGRHVGIQKKTGYPIRAGDFNAEYRISSRSRLIVGVQDFDQNDAWRVHKTLYGASWRGTAVGNEKKRALDHNRQLVYSQWHADEVGDWIDSAKFSLSYQRLEEFQHRIRSDDRSDKQGFEVQTMGLWSQLGSESRIGYWTYGIEYYRDFVDSFLKEYNADGSLRREGIQGPVGDDAAYDLLGLYVQNELPVSERLEAIFGLRYTYARADAEEVQDPLESDKEISIRDKWSDAVGSLRLLFHLNDQWNLYGGVSQGFRTPNLSDLTRLDSARSNEIEVPSPGLDPEKFLSLELGLKTEHDRLRGELAYYYTVIHDLIDRYPTGNIIDGENEVQKANTGDGYVTGFELKFAYRLTHEWSIRGGGAWTRGRADTFPTSEQIRDRAYMSRISPLTGTLGVLWEEPSKKYWAEVLLVAANNQDELSPGDKADTQRIPFGGTPGYVVYSLRGGTQITDNLSLCATVENITNKDYRIHGSGQNEPGTNFILSLDLRF